MEAAALISMVVLGVVGAALVLSLLNGIAIYVLWGWFIVPLGVPQISVSWAIGLSVVVALFQPTPPIPAKQDKKMQLWVNLLKAPTALGIGWVVKQFM